MNDINVRVCTSIDAPALAVLMTELGYPTSVPEMSQRFAQISQRSEYATFVAEADGGVIGMVGVAVVPSYVRRANGQIMALVVAPHMRGRGIGALLMARAEAWLARENVARAVATSAHRRADAHAFCERLGYRDTGRRFVKTLGD